MILSKEEEERVTKKYRLRKAGRKNFFGDIEMFWWYLHRYEDLSKSDMKMVVKVGIKDNQLTFVGVEYLVILSIGHSSCEEGTPLRGIDELDWLDKEFGITELINSSLAD